VSLCVCAAQLLRSFQGVLHRCQLPYICGFYSCGFDKMCYVAGQLEISATGTEACLSASFAAYGPGRGVGLVRERRERNGAILVVMLI
jgi:hypothetical protein